MHLRGIHQSASELSSYLTKAYAGPMPLTAEQQNELARFPAVLRALVEAELAAGNTVLEVEHGHPAAPMAACIKLANQVTTRPRASGDGIRFFERHHSSHSGEFTDEAQHFFVLEQPLLPPQPADMDAIREAFAERVRKSDEERFSKMMR
jgi:hypothetical protein